jgi:type VI secretion system protein ImpG
MMNADVLRGALSLYDWTQRDDNRRRIEAIHYVWLDEEEEVVGGRIDRIVNVNIGIEPNDFGGSGDVALFGDVLSRYVGRYASFHYAVRLVLYEGVGGPIRRFPCTVKTGGWL